MKKVAVIFGGMSSEHDVSIMSGKSVLKNIDKQKYDVNPVYIDKLGVWYTYDVNLDFNEEKLNKISNILDYLKQFDVVFPVLHGLYGEDGTIQGVLKMLNIPFVGCDVLSSSISMDKVYTKMAFEKADLPQTKYIYLKKEKDNLIIVDEKFNFNYASIDTIVNEVKNKLKYPVFVKPSNSGSSVGINKVVDEISLKDAINDALKYDTKILIEEGIIGRELECAIFEDNGEITVSCVGEIITSNNFYDYNTKYVDNTAKLEIPAKISSEIEDEIKERAKKAFRVVDGKNIARVDFFLDKDNNIYINEINTMPGFTSISMYPKLFEHSGINYTNLLSKLIEATINR